VEHFLLLHRVEVGVDKIRSVCFPLPFVPSHRGGEIFGGPLKMLEKNSQIKPCKILKEKVIILNFYKFVDVFFRMDELF